MIDKLFEYVQHEYNNAVRLLEMDIDMSAYSLINSACCRAYGAASYFCFIHPELEQDVHECWKI